MDDKNSAVFKSVFKPVSIYIFIPFTLHSPISPSPPKKHKKKVLGRAVFPLEFYTGQNHHELIFIHSIKHF